MSRPSFTGQIVIEGCTLIAAGFAPFLVQAATDTSWIVTGREGDNCIAFPDGMRAIFDTENAAIVLCQELNARAAR